MSQISPYSGTIIAAFQAELADFFTTYSMAALVAYEYLLTVNQEVTMIWQRKWTLVTWIFMLNRYLMIAFAILEASPNTAQSCFPSIILDDILILGQFVVFAAFSALRVFAIWDRHIPMTLLALVLNLTPVVVNMYSYVRSTVIFTVDPVFGPFCSFIINYSPRTTFQLSLGTRLAVIAADILVLAVTWRQTFRHRMAAIRAGVRTPLSAILLRDGTVYFLVLLAMNIAQVAVKTVPSLQTYSPVSDIIDTLTPILISRFLLNLRQLGEPENEAQSHFNSRFSIPGFRVPTLESIVENMGADLDHDPAEEVDDESEEADSDVEVTVLDAIAGDSSDGLVAESIYEIQEVSLQMA